MSMRRINNILFKAKHVPIVNPDKQPQLLTPSKNIIEDLKIAKHIIYTHGVILRLIAFKDAIYSINKK